MKAVKGFVKTCYSESLLSGSSTPENEREETVAKDEVLGESSESSYHGGLGLRFKFPGDPKKSLTFSLVG